MEEEAEEEVEKEEVEEVEVDVAEEEEGEVKIKVKVKVKDEGLVKTTIAMLHQIQIEGRHPLLLPAIQKSFKMAKREPMSTQSMKPTAFVGRKN